MGFRFSPCANCCNLCVKDGTSQLLLSVSGWQKYTNVVGADPPLANPTDCGNVNGSWYLEGPYTNWRGGDNNYHNGQLIFPTGFLRTCYYKADIAPIAWEYVEQWTGDGSPVDVVCTDYVTRLSFVIAEYEAAGGLFAYRFAVTWETDDARVLMYARTVSVTSPPAAQYDMDNVASDWVYPATGDAIISGGVGLSPAPPACSGAFDAAKNYFSVQHYLLCDKSVLESPTSVTIALVPE